MYGERTRGDRATLISSQQAVAAAVVAVVGYLLGSIPSGMIVARVYRNGDLTAHGSGRTGATNVLRTLGSGAAAIAFLGDFLKGVLAVLFVLALTANLIAVSASVVGTLEPHTAALARLAEATPVAIGGPATNSGLARRCRAIYLTEPIAGAAEVTLMPSG